MDKNFDFITSLQYRVKALTSRLSSFESGEIYIKMKSEFKIRLSEKDREIKSLKNDLAAARAQTVTARNRYQEVIEDLEDENKKQKKIFEQIISKLNDKINKLYMMIDDLKNKLSEKRRELYQALTELEEEKGKNQKLRAQINRDHENSSISSSMKMNRKKISNSREKTGRKPGGQPGHKGHGRKKQEPTNKVSIPAPEEYTKNPNYILTGKIIKKQLIGLRITVICDEFSTPEYRNIKTGVRVHADFPDNIQNDVNYDGSIKAFLYLLNNHCCTSMDKAQEFLSDLTNGKLNISKGMISGLSKEFSEKTTAMQNKAFADLLLEPVMNIDLTGAKVNGENVNVVVCASPGPIMYFARESKGHESIKGTPAYDYQHILAHDHDITFYSYGNAHQECLAHIIRYLLDSILNEPNLKWNLMMRDLLREMIHYRNSLKPDEDLDSDIVSEYEDKYNKILEKAKEEYEYEPPTKYYVEGYNLSKRLAEYKESHLLFLHNKLVPTTNNLAERLLRVFKRKQKQVMTFRSFESLTYICNGMGIIASLRADEQNLYENISSFFA